MKAINFLALILLASCGSRMEKPVAAIDSKDFQYKECFNESDAIRSTNVKGSGSVTVGFTIMPRGMVDDEKILASDFKDANFHSCLLEVTRSIKFPEPTSGFAMNTTKILNFSTKKKMNE